MADDQDGEVVKSRPLMLMDSLYEGALFQIEKMSSTGAGSTKGGRGKPKSSAFSVSLFTVFNLFWQAYKFLVFELKGIFLAQKFEPFF